MPLPLAVGYLLAAARVAIPIAARAEANTVGRGAATLVKRRALIGATAQPAIWSGDLPDVTRNGLIIKGVDLVLDGVGGSSSSGGSSRKGSSGRAKRNARKTNVPTKPQKPRPNRRTG